MDEYCTDKGFLSWFETSAKEDINISDAAKYLVSKVQFHFGYHFQNSFCFLFLIYFFFIPVRIQ